jgi:HSP20 family protein
VIAGIDQDAVDLAEDARRMLTELDRDVPGVATLTAECRPAIDVLETSTALEIIVDIPGVSAQSLRLAIRRSTLLVVGAKVSPATDAQARFHLAERSYGRFARVVRLTGAIDATRARATASAGELRVILPRIDDRRGSTFTIPVESA